MPTDAPTLTPGQNAGELPPPPLGATPESLAGTPWETEAQRKARLAAEKKAAEDAAKAAAAAAKQKATEESRSRTELAKLRANPNDQFALGYLLNHPDTTGGRELIATRSALATLAPTTTSVTTPPPDTASTPSFNPLQYLTPKNPAAPEETKFNWLTWLATHPLGNQWANYGIWTLLLLGLAWIGAKLLKR